MKLSQCKYGTIVVTKERTEVGMIVGITNNARSANIETRKMIDNAIPLVQFSGDLEPRGIHYGNLEIFKD